MPEIYRETLPQNIKQKEKERNVYELQNSTELGKPVEACISFMFIWIANNSVKIIALIFLIIV